MRADKNEWFSISSFHSFHSESFILIFHLLSQSLVPLRVRKGGGGWWLHSLSYRNTWQRHLLLFVEYKGKAGGEVMPCHMFNCVNPWSILGPSSGGSSRQHETAEDRLDYFWRRPNTLTHTRSMEEKSNLLLRHAVVYRKLAYKS